MQWMGMFHRSAQRNLTLNSSIFFISIQFLFQEWHHSCSTISFFLLTHLALLIGVEGFTLIFLFLFGLASFLFLCTRVFFTLAFQPLGMHYISLNSMFQCCMEFYFISYTKIYMLVWEFAFLSKKTLWTPHNHFLFVTTRKKFAPKKKTTTSLQQVFPSKIVENKTIAIPNSPYQFGYSDNYNNEIWKHNRQ
jgi:hypothetical protein